MPLFQLIFFSKVTLNDFRTISENYVTEAQHFSRESFKIGATLFDKCVILYDLGTPVNLSINMRYAIVMQIRFLPRKKKEILRTPLLTHLMVYITYVQFYI